MKDGMKGMALLLCAVFSFAALSACGNPGNPGVATSDGAGAVEAPEAVVSASDPAHPRTPAEVDLTDATHITLAGTSAQVDGNGAEASAGVITITSGGTFVLSGSLDDGRVIVHAGGEDVMLVLDGASIACSYGSPLYIYQCSSATVHLMEGTENTLADGENYTFADSLSSAAEEEPNACLYSKSDLLLQGSGALNVVANYQNGITSKDTLEIYDAVLTVTAVNHGINGKDSNTIDSATISVTCGGDAIRSSNDSDSNLGWIRISNSTLALTSGEDGIQAETELTLASSSCSITAGGGSAVRPEEDGSAKGIKAGTLLSLSGGVYTLDCSDDALHANGDLTISGGSFTISTGDDAVHADGTLTVSGGQLWVLKAYEGLEGTCVNITGGEIDVVCSDDGVNAAGGVDASGFGGRQEGAAFPAADSVCAITISGGTLSVTAGGDGLDSNGSIRMTGGTVLVSSTGNADSALDYDGSFLLEGGVLLAACAGNMAQAPTDPEQYTVSVQFDTTLPAGTYIQLAAEEAEFVFCLSEPANHIVFSAPELRAGAACSISYGGTYSGGSEGLLCTGGVYSGGTVLTELTLSDYLTTYGQVGMGGSRGGNIFGAAGQPGSFGRNGFANPEEEAPPAGNQEEPGGKRGG